MTRPNVALLLATSLLATASCNAPNAKLRRDNDRLRAELARLGSNSAPEKQALTRIRSFTVGLAASERDFDASAFSRMLRENLDSASQRKTVRVIRETDPRQINKIRGMLVQQYLAAEEVPIMITNLSFKLQDAKRVFKIGNQIVPVEGTDIAAAGGEAVTASHKNSLSAVMRRDAQGSYSVAYEEIGGGRGRVKIRIRDVDILDTVNRVRAQRQGDLSFNWRLNIEKIQVFRIENFQGDVGRFLSDMRYSGIHSSIGKYQTLRDFVFLFGYGSYITGLVNQIRTPAQITTVEVLPIDEATFAGIEGRQTEKEVLEMLGTDARWQNCKFVDITNGEKVWERPSAVGFPFVSRQISEGKKQVFYLKFNSKGAFFVGDYER